MSKSEWEILKKAQKPPFFKKLKQPGNSKCARKLIRIKQ